jgi:2'-5' RNA ligase
VPYEPGQSAVIVPVPAVEPLVSRWRRRLDVSTRHGVPAHVTVLYPFLHQSRLDDGVLARLGSVCATTAALEVVFSRLARFPNVLYLQPEPSEPFRRLTAAVVEQWPQTPPYGGAHVEVIPHLTVAHDVDEVAFSAAERDVAPHLPVRAWVDAAWLYSYDGERWRPRARLPFG